MAILTRRSVLRGSSGAGRGRERWRGPISPTPRRRPRTCGGSRASSQEEDVAFKKIVADYEKASGNTIDYSIIPFAPMRQKIVSAVTSGVVPDLFSEHPGRDHCAVCLGGQAGRRHRRRRDAKGGIHRDRAALVHCYNNVDEEAQLLWRALYTAGVAEPYLAAAGREGRLQDRGHPEDLGCLL